MILKDFEMTDWQITKRDDGNCPYYHHAGD